MDFYYENRPVPISVETQSVLTSLPHCHNAIEIVYVQHGSAEAFADHYHAKMDKGDIFISFPNQIHYYKNCDKGTYFVAIAEADFFYGLDSVLRKSTPKRNTFATKPSSDYLKLFKAANQVKESDPHRTTRLCGFINLIISDIIPELELKPVLQSDNSTLKAILDFCGHNYSLNLSLDDLAENLHLSKYYISHVINRRLGLSFNEYLNSLRIEAACDKLKDSTQRIADVSEEVGFGSIRSFNRIFKELMGITPLQYRKQFEETP